MKEKILIIDDAKFNREMLEEMLEEEYTILVADNGQEGLEVFEQHKKEICVILLDLVMPVMDGYEFMEKMKEKGYDSLVPVLIISGEQSGYVERKCFDIGVIDFIRKPFGSSWIIMRVKNAIDLFRYRKNEKIFVKDALEKIIEDKSQTKEEILDKLQEIVKECY